MNLYNVKRKKSMIIRRKQEWSSSSKAAGVKQIVLKRTNEIIQIIHRINLP